MQVSCSADLPRDRGGDRQRQRETTAHTEMSSKGVFGGEVAVQETFHGSINERTLACA